jgi:hypothetical protein
VLWLPCSSASSSLSSWSALPPAWPLPPATDASTPPAAHVSWRHRWQASLIRRLTTLEQGISGRALIVRRFYLGHSFSRVPVGCGLRTADAEYDQLVALVSQLLCLSQRSAAPYSVCRHFWLAYLGDLHSCGRRTRGSWESRWRRTASRGRPWWVMSEVQTSSGMFLPKKKVRVSFEFSSHEDMPCHFLTDSRKW